MFNRRKILGFFGLGAAASVVGASAAPKYASGGVVQNLDHFAPMPRFGENMSVEFYKPPTLRVEVGRPLTMLEMDQNFRSLHERIARLEGREP